MFLCIEVLEEAYTGFHQEKQEKIPSLKIQNNTEIADNKALGKYPSILFLQTMGKSITSKWVNNSLRDGRKKIETLSSWTCYFILFIKENLVFNPRTIFLSEDWLQNVPDLTITSFSLKYAARSCTWRTSFALHQLHFTVCWLAGFPFPHSLLLSLFSMKSGSKEL